MINALKYILYSFCLVLISLPVYSQETLDANNPNNFVLGGDQGSNLASLNLVPISIVDVEPDPNNTLTFGGIAVNLEAGSPASGVAGNTNEDLWLNFTHRADNSQPKQIYVRSNFPIPAGMTITIQIINSASIGGNYTSTPNLTPITLSNTNQVIVFNFNSGYTGDGIGTGYQLKYDINNTGGVTLPSGFEIIYSIQ